jgi:hypothetical protein
MATLTYFMITSVDGYTTASDGDFAWAEPSPATHRHALGLTSGLAGEIYGPRMWETMRFWEGVRPGDGGDYGDLAEEMYAYGEAWRANPHFVFSRAEGKPLTLDALRQLKASHDGELSISGPGLAAIAIGWGEVDVVARYVVPHATGGGTPWWPRGESARLELAHHEELDAGWLYERYAVTRAA